VERTGHGDELDRLDGLDDKLERDEVRLAMSATEHAASAMRVRMAPPFVGRRGAFL
jgi:hypothetical protein